MTSDTKPSDSGRDVLKLLYSNICALRKTTNDLDQDKQQTVTEVQVKFNSCLNQLNIQLSDESDPDSDD